MRVVRLGQRGALHGVANTSSRYKKTHAVANVGEVKECDVLIGPFLIYEQRRTYKVINSIHPDDAIKLQAQKKRLIIKSIAFNNALLIRKTTLYKYYLICHRGSTYTLLYYIKRLFWGLCNADLLRYQYPHLTDSQLENISP